MPKHTITFSAESEKGLKLSAMMVACLALYDDVEDIGSTIEGKKGKAAPPPADDDEEEAAPAPKAKKGKAPTPPADDDEEEAPAPKAKKGKAADPLDELADEDNEEKDAMMASLSKLAKLTKKEGVKQILAKLKVDSVDDIPEERYEAVTAAAEKMIAAHEADE